MDVIFRDNVSWDEAQEQEANAKIVANSSQLVPTDKAGKWSTFYINSLIRLIRPFGY